MENQVVIVSVMVVYVILLILWGVFQGWKVKTGYDFAIAERRVLKFSVTPATHELAGLGKR